MIDQKLIEQASQHLARAIQDKHSTSCQDLFLITHVIDQLSLDKLQIYLSTVDENKWQNVQGTSNYRRQRISWDNDTIVEELHDAFALLTPQINDIFPACIKNFWGISIWKDSPGYTIGWHTDDPDIDTAMQVYLYTVPGNGTVFGSESDFLIVPSEHNTGYLLEQQQNNRVPHRSERPVPKDITRYSLYAVWSRFPKNSAHT